MRYWIIENKYHGMVGINIFPSREIAELAATRHFSLKEYTLTEVFVADMGCVQDWVRSDDNES